MTAPRARLIVGAVPEALAEFSDGTFDAIVTDPPYLLGFMNRNFDKQDGAHGDPKKMQAWHETWAREALRVLKPGAFAVVAGGSRTFHRLVCAMEDAGFRIVDCITHLHGQGFPKAGYVDRDRFPGMAGSLKPSVEFWTLAQKPVVGAIAANLARHGTGALNIDAARIRSNGGSPSVLRCATHARRLASEPDARARPSGIFATRDDGTLYEESAEHYLRERPGEQLGRYPSNVIFSHVTPDPETGSPGCVRVGTKRVTTQTGVSGGSPEGVGVYGNNFPRGDGREVGYADADGMEEVEDWRCMSECPVRMLDEQAGERTSGSLLTHHRRRGESPIGTFKIRDRTGEPCNFGGDTGSAARFFFCAKAATSERWGLCKTCDMVFQFNADPQPAPDCPRHGTRQPDSGPLFGGVAEPACACPPRALDAHAGHDRVLHPTVKPLDLMRWLVRLVVPPGGLLLDCFAGTGSTGVAALREGFRAVLVERDPDYARIAAGRLRAEGA